MRTITREREVDTNAPFKTARRNGRRAAPYRCGNDAFDNGRAEERATECVKERATECAKE
ncbi:MAG: hypothetical protein ACI4NG_03510 [Candidatus Gallimonas sp.]